MPDPRISRPSDPEFYRYVETPAPPGGFPSFRQNRSVAQLTEDAYQAHVKLRKQVTINDTLLAQQLELKEQLKVERNWRWGISATVIGTVIKLLLPQLLNFLLR